MPKRRKVAVLFSTAHQAYVQILKGIADYAKQNENWTLNVNPEPFINLAVPSLAGWHGHGVIMRLVNKQDVKSAKALGLPVVNVGGVLRQTDVPSVNFDQIAVGRIAAEHLIECGFRRFAYYGLKDTWFSEQRRDGFVDCVTRAGGKCSVFEVPNSVSRSQPWHIWLRKLERWLKTLKPPVGLLAVHDPRASMVVDTCLRLGLRVPGDVAVVGVENHEVVCEFAQVRLTSVAPRNREVGYEAAALLDRLMARKPAPEGSVLVLPRGIVRRDSTNVIAVEEPHVAAAVRYIRDHISEPFGVEALEQTAGISRRGFERLFKECMGHTPHQYICRARVDRAKELLTGPEKLRLEQIARACGFSETRHLRLTFQRIAGVTPAEYRRSHFARIAKDDSRRTP